jgi:P2-related tail formation protein
MEALGVTVDLTEWWQTGAEPHTFELTAWVNANLRPDAPSVLNSELYAALQRAVDGAKPARSHYVFRVGARFQDGIGLAGTAQAVALVRSSVRL